jgi:hypothetical protein
LAQEESHYVGQLGCREKIGQHGYPVPLQGPQGVSQVGVPTRCQGGMPGSDTCRQDTGDAPSDGGVGNAALGIVGRSVTRNKTTTGSQSRIGYHYHTTK